eukprot:CAMPEP_0204050482 /NCGR_PEP_ID=MMETSP0360-20130528/120443_1 /ASSEMBLY_ACC=CAM_ASM_000342 /TAXON_ID=268821 /ORGANISM="Scrippsiella Hangoei, Strain SHTV-5" /LENGTH=45 /DNA_ID= /DNA_START= /DNA_END= /DNA_ORIENTATION=
MQLSPEPGLLHGADIVADVVHQAALEGEAYTGEGNQKQAIGPVTA